MNCGWCMARPWICSPATTSTATACSTRTKRIRPAAAELNYGLFEYTTVYTREPNFHADGTSLTNVNTARRQDLQTLFEDAGVGNASHLAGQLISQQHLGTAVLQGLLDFCCPVRDVRHEFGRFCQNFR